MLRVLRHRRAIPALVLGLVAACSGAGAGRSGGASNGIEVPPAVAHPPRPSAIDVESYALDLDLDPATRSFRGTCRVRLRAVEDGLRTVALDLHGLDVRSVKDRAGRALPFTHAAGVLAISLPEPALRQTSLELVVEYGGAPKKGLWFSNERDGAPTQVFTQGECEDARWWFPCHDVPSDRAVSELRVTMPVAWTSVAAGQRIERVEQPEGPGHGRRATELWRMSTPHPSYLETLVAGEFATRTEIVDGTELVYLAAPEHAGALELAFEPTPRVLAFFSEVTGVRYPYPKYSQACVANFPFGGMENISATTLTDTTLVDERGRRDGTSTGLIAHEAAHQWFGDLLTCADWSQVWLNEGFATYLGALFTERDRGVDEFRAQMRDIQDGYVAADVGKNRRAVVSDVYRDPLDLFFTGHVYAGGAARLHLLRFGVGDEAFFRGIKLYVGRNAGRGVVTDDLRRALEEASGADLSAFFEQWFLKPGFPKFEVSWRYDAPRKIVLLAVNQVQEIAGGVPEIFRTPVDVVVSSESGIRIHHLQLDKRRELFQLPSEETPVFVRFDPHGWIPKELEERKPTAEWLAIAGQDDDVNGRRDAVRALGRVLEAAIKQKAGTAETREKLFETLALRLSGDTSPAVRSGAAAALAAGVALEKSPAARTALSAAAEGDGEARVRAAALSALCAVGPDPQNAELASRVYAAGFSWNVIGAAARLRCAALPADAFDWLHGELADDSRRGALRAQLVPVLGSLKDARGLQLLLAIAVDEHGSEAGRVAAVRELGKIGRGQPDVRVALARLLETRDWRLRREAIAALAGLEDPAVLPVLRAYYAGTVFPQERRAIEAAFREEPGSG